MLDASSTKFPEQLRKARTKAGHSQTSLAAAVGASSGSVSNWETGVNVPREDTINKLNAELFSVEPNKTSSALTIASPSSKKGKAKTTHASSNNSSVSIKSFDTDDLAKELKRRGYTVTLVV